MNPFPFEIEALGPLMDLLSVGMLVLDAEGRLEQVNRTAELLCGQPAERLQGRSCRQTIAPRLCATGCVFEKARQHPNTYFPDLVDMVDEAAHPLQLLKIAIPYGDPDAPACIELLQDVSLFSELFERLGDEERKLSTILDHLEIGILSCDRGGHITFFNKMAETLTGYAREELLGSACREMFGETFCTDLDHNVDPAAGPYGSHETRLKTKNGSLLPITAKQLQLAGNKGRAVGRLTTFADLSLVHQYRKVLHDRYTFEDMIGRDAAMQKIFEVLPSIAQSNATVLIEGATGVGKDLLAKAIHNASRRKAKTLVKVNCAALPENLLESELFGYVKGAFTGADRDKPGRFQDAHGGTIFLDEIGDMPLVLQAKLLRVLEDREFYPLGGRRPTKVDVRIVSATNRGLADLVRDKLFRDDLYFRINVMRIELPDLKERPSDIPLLINHILQRLCAAEHKTSKTLSESALKRLLDYDYPGNVRELENILSHALVVSKSDVIPLSALPLHLQQAPRLLSPVSAPHPATSPPPVYAMIGADQERQLLTAALEQNNWRRDRTARMLGINRTTLWRRMKRLHLSE